MFCKKDALRKTQSHFFDEVASQRAGKRLCNRCFIWTLRNLSEYLIYRAHLWATASVYHIYIFFSLRFSSPLFLEDHIKSQSVLLFFLSFQAQTQYRHDVSDVLKTYYRHWNDVVYLLGNAILLSSRLIYLTISNVTTTESRDGSRPVATSKMERFEINS